MIDLLEGKYAKYLEKGKKAKSKEKAKEFNKIKVAKKAYDMEIKSLKKKLSEINKLVDNHIAWQRKEPLEWKYVGDVTLWNSKLDEVIQLLKVVKAPRRN
jgi:chaperonin cofactor prefoldin